MASNVVHLNTRKFASLAFTAIVFIGAAIFLVAANVSTDKRGLKISHLPVYRYLTVVLVIAIIWMCTFIFSKHLFKKCSRTGWLASHIEPKKELLPPHLLVGVMFFGLGSSFLTMVEILQFMAEINCPSNDLTMVLYYGTRTVFIYTQLYFFYKLSRKSEKVLIYGHFLMMLLIAVNLATWLVTFVYDSAEELNEMHESSLIHDSTMLFMAWHWGINLANVTNSTNSTTQACMETVEALESTAKKMEPYLYTFTMEYCLISAGLMLNTWLWLRKTMDTSNENRNTVTGHCSTDRDSGGFIQKRTRQDINHNQRSVEYRGKRRKQSSNYGSINSGNSTAGFDTDEYEKIETPISTEEVSTLWRFGFILGLAYIPMFVAIIFNLLFTDDKEQDQLIYIGMQCFSFLSILVASLIGLRHLRKIHKSTSHSQVDFILLAVSLVGVLFLDFLIIVAAFCEVHEQPAIASFLIVTNLMELTCSVMFTLFVREALKYELDPEMSEHEISSMIYSASKIREVVSFLFMLNICFWGMYTFEVKKSQKVLDVVEQFYTEKVWFYLSHFVYPMAVFFHFHGAVCMFEVLDHYTITRPPNEDTSASMSISVRA